MPVCNGLLCVMALGPRDCAVNGRCSSCSDIFGLIVFGLAGEDGEGGHVLTCRMFASYWRENAVGPTELISGGSDVRDFVPRCHGCTAKITMVGG